MSAQVNVFCLLFLGAIITVLTTLTTFQVVTMLLLGLKSLLVKIPVFQGLDAEARNGQVRGAMFIIACSMAVTMMRCLMRIIAKKTTCLICSNMRPDNQVLSFQTEEIPLRPLSKGEKDPKEMFSIPEL